MKPKFSQGRQTEYKQKMIKKKEKKVKNAMQKFIFGHIKGVPGW